MIHYHGGPIWPETCAHRAWAGRHAFVAFPRPDQLELAAAVCQSFALDNGAFSVWRDTGGAPASWDPFYEWAERWLTHPACDWAVIPDVIGGTEAENDALVEQWPFAPTTGVPVWHLNESPERLVALAAAFPRVALGSAEQYDVAQPERALARLAEVLPAICVDGRPTVKLHGLRMLNPAIVARVPLSSADSTTVARNVGIDVRWRGPYEPATRETRAQVIAERLEATPSPGRLSEMAWQPEFDLLQPTTTEGDTER